jgi:hypothetical protein
MKTKHKKKTLVTGAARLDVGNLLWAVALILNSKPHADDHNYLMSQYRSLVKALGMSMNPRGRTNPQRGFSNIELENMFYLIEEAVKGVASARVHNAANKLKSQISALRRQHGR